MTMPLSSASDVSWTALTLLKGFQAIKAWREAIIIKWIEPCLIGVLGPLVTFENQLAILWRQLQDQCTGGASISASISSSTDASTYIGNENVNLDAGANFTSTSASHNNATAIGQAIVAVSTFLQQPSGNLHEQEHLDLNFNTFTSAGTGAGNISTSGTMNAMSTHGSGRRLSFLPPYVEDVSAFRETSMSFATLAMLYVIFTCLLAIFMSCFYHNQKTSPLFISPRRHRLPKLVPPPLPVDGFTSWVKICFFLSDEEIINRIGFDSLIFLRFHRLALRCIVKMSVFSFIVLLPLNFTGGGHANASDLKGYVGSLLFTDFLRFTMANVSGGSPRLWVHCFAAYLLTAIVCRELLVEYEAFNNIRHRYLLSKEPHLRTVLVTNIPRHLRSAEKIGTYFKNVYPNAVKSVTMCQNLIRLEQLITRRTSLLTRIEQELLLLCRAEKIKLYAQSTLSKVCSTSTYSCCCHTNRQDRLAKLYGKLEDMNSQIEAEQRRRVRVMNKLDQMEPGQAGRNDIAYILASPFVHSQEQIAGLYRPPPMTTNTATATTTAQMLRSRSPQPVNNPNTNLPPEMAQEDGLFRDTLPNTQDKAHNINKKKRISYSKAKQAIKRYSKLARNNVSFLGRPQTSDSCGGGPDDLEEHINEVTDKAFVEMRTFTASTIAIQSMHSSKPGSMQVATAPEPRDILWENIYVSKGAVRTRSFLGETLVLLLIGFYVVPVALVSLLVSESALVSSSSRLAQLDQASAFFSSAIAMVQPLCIVGIQQLLPPLFIAIGRTEGIVSFSEVQMRAFSRYFLFQVVNIFLVTTIAGSIFDTIAIIIDNPEAMFELLGNSLPRMSSFFITFVTMKTFLGLGVELVRTMSLVQSLLRFVLFPNATLRMKRNTVMGLRAIDDPGWFPFHKILAQDMLVVVISVVFAVVAPMVLLPCAMFCLFSRIMWTHHHLYVYESVFETGGQFWPKIFRRFVFGLIIAQMTITGQFFLKEARHEAYATIALIFMTYFFLRSTRARYDPSSSTLPLEVATVMDISLTHEEDALRRWHQQQQVAREQQQQQSRQRTREGPESDRQTHGTAASIPESSELEHDVVGPALGTLIGQHDPFKQAYIQPALRANPRARPEQPFPPNQLGREDVLMGNSSGTTTMEDECSGSGGTVRLKSMNQQDRRLVNRWWNDQLQRCGDQPILPILIGEECGTLTTGRRGANLIEMSRSEPV